MVEWKRMQTTSWYLVFDAFHLPLRITKPFWHSLRSKRFREAKSEEKAKNGGFGVLPARKWGESKNKKEGVGEGKEGNACRQTP